MALLLYFTPENVGGIIIIATVAPIIYLNTLTSLENMNKELDEIADVFGAGTFTRAFRVHFPQIVPSLFASANIGIGFAFKSAITAQVISLTAGSIGEQVYLAKLYIDSNLLTAWLIIILITGSLLQAGISFIFSRLAYDYNLKKSS
jgi:NitT/TauT family transport system permease protein